MIEENGRYFDLSGANSSCLCFLHQAQQLLRASVRGSWQPGGFLLQEQRWEVLPAAGQQGTADSASCLQRWKPSGCGHHAMGGESPRRKKQLGRFPRGCAQTDSMHFNVWTTLTFRPTHWYIDMCIQTHMQSTGTLNAPLCTQGLCPLSPSLSTRAPALTNISAHTLSHISADGRKQMDTHATVQWLPREEQCGQGSGSGSGSGSGEIRGRESCALVRSPRWNKLGCAEHVCVCEVIFFFLHWPWPVWWWHWGVWPDRGWPAAASPSGTTHLGSNPALPQMAAGCLKPKHCGQGHMVQIKRCYNALKRLNPNDRKTYFITPSGTRTLTLSFEIFVVYYTLNEHLYKRENLI